MTYTRGLKEAAVRMYTEGASTYEVGAALGVGRDTVRVWAHEAGVIRSTPKSGRRFSPEVRRAIVEEYDAEAPIAEIAERYGISKEGIRRVVRRTRIQMRPQGRRRPDWRASDEERALATTLASAAKDLDVGECEISGEIQDGYCFAHREPALLGGALCITGDAGRRLRAALAEHAERRKGA